MAPTRRAATTATMTTSALLAIAAAAHGQAALNGVNIVVEDTTLELGESTTIRLEAYFDPALYAMSGIETSLFSSEGRTGLSDWRLLAPMDGPGTSVGRPGADGVDGILAGQIHGLAGIYGDTTNPMPFWEATYTAPVAGAEPIFVDLATETTRFAVYLWRDSAQSESRLGDFAEGTARIHIVPAPAGALVLVPAVLAMPAWRRRRER
ncbi:MAG: hypothetical protein ACFCBV_08275 [Phycisphaerales bacterium]